LIYYSHQVRYDISVRFYQSWVLKRGVWSMDCYWVKIRDPSLYCRSIQTIRCKSFIGSFGFACGSNHANNLPNIADFKYSASTTINLYCYISNFLLFPYRWIPFGHSIFPDVSHAYVCSGFFSESIRH